MREREREKNLPYNNGSHNNNQKSIQNKTKKQIYTLYRQKEPPV